MPWAHVGPSLGPSLRQGSGPWAWPIQRQPFSLEPPIPPLEPSSFQPIQTLCQVDLFRMTTPSAPRSWHSRGPRSLAGEGTISQHSNPRWGFHRSRTAQSFTAQPATQSTLQPLTLGKTFVHLRPHASQQFCPYGVHQLIPNQLCWPRVTPCPTHGYSFLRCPWLHL